MVENTPLVLIILDGFGISEKEKGNAIRAAQMPNYFSYIKNFPSTQLKASGESVGLLPGFQGNSEVGHLHIGAGRNVPQLMLQAFNSIKDNSFFKNSILLKAIENCKKHNSSLHLMGLLSDEGVHAHINHLFALMKLAKQNSIDKVFIHCFLDGRDVPEKSAKKYIKMLEEKIVELKIGKIASIVGRYYAMDRDKNYNRTQKAYNLLVEGKGFQETDALKAVENAYKRGDKTDYYVQPIVLTENGKPIAKISENDSIIFYNYRNDRARQLTYSFVDEKFSKFPIKKFNKLFVCFSNYDKRLKLNYVFEHVKVDKNLTQILAENNLKQLKVAETEKYAHVTFFLNSQIEKPFPGEERILVDSPKVPSYDLKPEMNAEGIKKEVLKALTSNKFDVIVVNFANPDLVGHSGVFDAVVKGIEKVDSCLGEIIPIVLDKKGTVLITSDHGNAEEMLLDSGKPNPSHTTNPVPFVLISEKRELRTIKLHEGSLIDVSPTILKLLNLPQPKEMTGKSLF